MCTSLVWNLHGKNLSSLVECKQGQQVAPALLFPRAVICPDVPSDHSSAAPTH